MTDKLRQAAEIALEALEWSYGGEPMPTKEIEAINAIRQALDQKGNEMTYKLNETVKTAIQELKQVVTTLDFLRVWRGNGWEYFPMLPDQYLPLRNTIDWQVAYLKRALTEWTPDDTAYRPDGLSQDELPPVKNYCKGKPNYCEPEMDKQCSSCGGFCGDVCERENVKPDLLNQTCCGCGLSGGYALYCGWCWSEFNKPVADVNTSEERVPNSDKQGHECQELKASGPIGEIVEAHGLIAVSIPEMPPVGTKLYATPHKLWVTLSDDDIKEIVGPWGDTPIRGYTRKLFDEIDLMYRKRNFG